MSHQELTCVLCGAFSHDVRTALIRWIEPVGRDVFTSAPRCSDKAACRTRLEATGERWDVLDPPRSTREIIGHD